MSDETWTEATGADEAVHVGMFVVHGPSGNRAALERFAGEAVEPIEASMEDATGRSWEFHLEEAHQLPDHEPRSPSEFVDEAALRMVSGPYDLVIAVTDVGLSSLRSRIESGAASPVARIVVLSTRQLRRTPRGQKPGNLDEPSLVTNASTLLLRLVGRIFGLEEEQRGVMAPFRFDARREDIPEFSQANKRRLERAARTFPERELEASGRWPRVVFYLTTLLSHGREVLAALRRNRAPLLPLSLPALSTAAITPALVLIFSAETWDVGLHITTGISVLSSLASIVAATLFLIFSHDLYVPRGQKRRLTEHLAVVNVTITASVLLAAVGLFVLLGTLMLAIEVLIFPPDLITEWPSLQDPTVTSGDFVRLAAFVSALGVISGALGGGLDSRSVIQHLALFVDEP